MTKLTMRRIFLALFACALAVTSFGAAQAQSPFSPAIRVNDRAITYYEIDQRIMLMEALSAPGDLPKEARKQLIEDRLKLDAAFAIGVNITEEMITAGIKDFAGRAKMTPEKFMDYLASKGVARQTFEDFLFSGLAWREVVRAKFASRLAVTDEDIDKAQRALANNSSTQVLLSEIFIPVPQGREDEAMELALLIQKDQTFAGFAANAKRYSRGRTREQGGKINWMPLTNLPPQLRPVIMALKPAEITQPLPVQGALALFQMRSVGESAYRAPAIAAIEYAALRIAGGHTPEALTSAQKIMDQADTCDDLYGLVQGQPEENLTRVTLKPGEIPRDIALELAKMDKGEFSTALTRNDGQTLMLLMMCGRTPALTEDASREELTAQLRNRRAEALANGYLEQLRADARIIEE
ncbi:peptidylprolyl isomerase [Thalassobius sp. S69A]|uniref:peptidylprolyl isomerase n=1 Tax=unclassified Thalassovita TaxID=2619711 RepID=UPI000C5476C6|nr:peptidylprolyl isomerase [Paracoccaceae bacterium]